MADINGLLEQISKELEISRLGMHVYHAALGAGKNGRQVEAAMPVTELKALRVAQRLLLIKIFADYGNLEEVRRFLKTDIDTSSIPQVPD